METTKGFIGVLLGLCGDNGQNGNYHIILGLYWGYNGNNGYMSV